MKVYWGLSPYFVKLPYTPLNPKPHMRYSLNSLKWVKNGIINGTTIGVVRGKTGTLDYIAHIL